LHRAIKLLTSLLAARSNITLQVAGYEVTTFLTFIRSFHAESMSSI
jgi:hypothetical protein